jgi:hypothetical protein
MFRNSFKIGLVLIALAASVLLLAAPTARAALVNPSFESPVVTAETLAVPTGWNNGTPGYAVYQELFGTNGSQAVELQSGCSIWQNTGYLLQYGDTYTVKVDTKGSKDSGYTDKVFLGYADDAAGSGIGTTFAGQQFDLTKSWLTDATCSATYYGDPGKYLTIILNNNMAGSWDDFDNVRLTSSGNLVEGQQTPEPSTLVLATTALFALLAYAWRRRK